MKKVKIVLMAALFLLGFVVSRPLTVKAADEGSPMMKMEPMGMKGGMADMKKPEVAVEGHCPVCMMAGMHMEGKDEFMTEYKGKVYKFESDEHKKMFLADPEKYTKDLDAKYKEMESKEGDEKMEAAPMKDAAPTPAPAPAGKY